MDDDHASPLSAALRPTTDLENIALKDPEEDLIVTAEFLHG